MYNQSVAEGKTIAIISYITIIGTVIALPIGWYLMNSWLQNYAYRIHFEWWMFTITILITLTIALITVFWQAMRTAIKNPVDSLRYE